MNATAQVLRANIAELMDPIPVLANEVWKHAMTSLQWLLPKSCMCFDGGKNIHLNCGEVLIMSSSHLARVSVAAIQTICNLLRMALVYFGVRFLMFFNSLEYNTSRQSGMLVIFSASRRFSREALVAESETQPNGSLRYLKLIWC